MRVRITGINEGGPAGAPGIVPAGGVARYTVSCIEATEAMGVVPGAGGPFNIPMPVEDAQDLKIGGTYEISFKAAAGPKAG